MPSPIKVTIVATAATRDVEKELSWEVDIVIDGEIVKKGITVSDPLKRQDRVLCRWYQDKYRQSEPYSTTKAKSAEALLKNYGRALESQLQLRPLFGDYTRINVDVQDGFSDATPRSLSIQHLFWEFLEDESLWEQTTSVLVKRLVGEPQRGSHVAIGESIGQIKILLITARDLTLDSENEDISPCLISDILWGIHSKASFNLAIEIVRPSTFNSLKLHLQHTGGLYHIVHFDTHGIVGLDEQKTPTGYLLFNDPETNELTPVSVVEIVPLFKEHPIPLVAFNACDSAHASAGSNANIAQVFASSSQIDNVLGMTHKASESATAQFFRKFYESLLLEHTSFSEALKRSRKSLRDDQMRNARFGLSIAVVDWAIPVVYSSGTDFTVPYLKPTEAATASQTATPPARAQVEEVSGRAFDILRFESKLLSSEGPVYVHGPHGIGKTMFLRKLVDSWERSNFVTKTIFIQFQEYQIQTAQDFVMVALGLAGYDIWAVPQELPNYACYFEKQFLDFFSPYRAAFILEGLVDPSPNTVQRKPNLMPNVIGLLKRLQELSTSRVFVLISGRTRAASAGLKYLGWKVADFELQGLHKSDAVTVVQATTWRRNSQVSVEASYDLKDLWKSEPLSHLTRGNPYLLRTFGEVAGKANLSLTGVYSILNGEDPVSSLDLKRLLECDRVFQEFLSIASKVTDDCLAVWIVLAWFWHEGPTISQLCTLMKETGIVPEDGTIRRALNEATRWAYLEEDGTRIVQINPVFTIFCRVYALSSLCRVQLEESSGWKYFSRNFASQTAKVILPNGPHQLAWGNGPHHGLKYAVQLLKAALTKDITREMFPPYYLFLIRYFPAVDSIFEVMGTNMLKKGMHHPDQYKDSELAKENLNFVLKICSGTGMWPVPHKCWPRQLLLAAHIIVLILNVDEAVAMAEVFERLLHGVISFSRFYGGGVVQQEDVGAVVGLTSHLSEMHRRHIPKVKSRKEEFIALSRDVLREVEAKYGDIKDPAFMIAKSEHMVGESILKMEERRGDESKEFLRQATSMFNDSCNVKNMNDSDFLKDKTPQEAAMWRAFAASLPDQTIKMQKVWDIALAQNMGQSLDTYQAPPQPSVAAAAPPIHTYWDILLQNYRVFDDPSMEAERYEGDRDRGHWRREMGYHTGAITASFAKLDFEQVEAHILAQEEIARRYGVEEETSEMLQDGKSIMLMLKDMFLGAHDGSLTKEQAVAAKDHLVRSAEKQGVDITGTSRLMDIVIDSWERDRDPSLPHYHAPAVLNGTGDDFMSHAGMVLQRHLPRASHDNKYAQALNHALVNALNALEAVEAAEDDNDEDMIFRRLDEMEALAPQRMLQDVINVKGIEKRRAWNCARLLSITLEAVKESSELDDPFADADGLISKLHHARRIITLSGQQDKPNYKEALEQIEGQIPNFQLTSLCKQAANVEDDEDGAAFGKIVETTLGLFKQEQFVQLLEEEVHLRSVSIMCKQYFGSSLQAALREGDSARAESLFDAIKALPPRILQDKNFAEAADKAQKIYLKLSCIDKFWNSLEKLDFPGARDALEELRARASCEDDQKAFDAMIQLCEEKVMDAISRYFRYGESKARIAVAAVTSELRAQGVLR